MRAALVLFSFVTLSLVLMPVQTALRVYAPRHALKLQHGYWRAVARLIGMKVTVEGTLAHKGPALITANHVSWLDIIAISAVRPVSFIAKADVAGWPFFGTIARLGGTIFIDRTRKAATRPAAHEIRKRLARGEMLVLFAEGTSSEGTSVLPFRSSLFAAANAAPDLPVLPVALAYTGRHGVPLARAKRAEFAWVGDMDLLSHLRKIAAHGPFEVELSAAPALTLQDHASRKALARAAEAAVRHRLAGLLNPRQIR